MIPLVRVVQPNNPTSFADALNTEEPSDSDFYHGKGEFEPWNDVVIWEVIFIRGDAEVAMRFDFDFCLTLVRSHQTKDVCQKVAGEAVHSLRSDPLFQYIEPKEVCSATVC